MVPLDSILIKVEMLSLTAEIDEFKGAWQQITLDHANTDLLDFPIA